MRERVYNSARNALAGMLSRSDNLTPEAIYVQQQRLETAILEIEARYSAPLPVAGEPAVAEPVLADPPAPVEGQPPDVAMDQGDERAFQPEPGPADVYAEPEPDYAGQAMAPNMDIPLRPRRRIFSKLLMASIVVAAFGMVGWWAYEQNLFTTPEQRDTSVPNPPKVIESEDFSSEPASGSNAKGENREQWITVYEPNDPEGIITNGIITAELMSDGDGPYIRLKAPSGADGVGVKFKVEPGVMESLRSRNATFELKVKSATGKDHQFAVTCQLKQLGNCGRKRFSAGSQVGSFVFKVRLKDHVVSGTEKSGLLSINTDISGSGKALDIYMIRVSTE